MWREYVKMELGFVESLRRRWGVLGIDVEDTKGKGKQRAREADEDEEMEVEKIQVDAEDEGDEGEAARRQIMQGAIVKSVMSSAAKALPKIELFISLQDLLATYPCPASLRDTLLDHLFTLLHETLPADPAAIRLFATRRLLPDLEGEALVDTLKDANERLSSAVRDQNAADERLASAYASFVRDWCQKDIDDSLKGYLITSLQLLAQRKSATPSPALLAETITLLTAYQDSLHEYLPPTSNTPERVLRLARKFTGKDNTKHSAQVWLARLDAEKQFATGEDAKRAWDEARGVVVGTGTDTVWLWGLDPEPDWETTNGRGTGSMETEVGERVRLLERLLGEGHRMQDATAWSAVQETLLMRYAKATDIELKIRLRLETVEEGEVPPAGIRKRKRARGDTGSDARSPSMAYVDARAARVRHVGAAYLMTARVWREVFAQEEAASEEVPACSGRVLETIFEQWRRKDGVHATIAWARWLLAHGKAKAATDIVMRARSSLSDVERIELEHLWKKEVDEDVEATSRDDLEMDPRVSL
ncbi:uncharacterized protein B0H18DRAFT_957255 [Fomitopsis serialis]|uniref:uncharacterized protein n=1 Tax=Fomitopsis serialis TaxID=139415 RepID=UPI002007701B|nr:uncharacterized protein B0H18DRAFT_957255 [Neoantrodia serialis]KAH9920077.1 hypothetical protein B0H18DRAFT_957255 [Neoantrodia serialis]